MIKKTPGEKRKFRAEYLTLSKSELCRGNGRRSARGVRTGNEEEIGSEQAAEETKSRRDVVHGIQRGIVSRVYANLKDPPLRLASHEDRSGGSLEISTLSRRRLKTL